MQQSIEKKGFCSSVLKKKYLFSLDSLERCFLKNYNLFGL